MTAILSVTWEASLTVIGLGYAISPSSPPSQIRIPQSSCPLTMFGQLNDWNSSCWLNCWSPPGTTTIDPGGTTVVRAKHLFMSAGTCYDSLNDIPEMLSMHSTTKKRIQNVYISGSSSYHNRKAKIIAHPACLHKVKLKKAVISSVALKSLSRSLTLKPWSLTSRQTY
jgi:hypothetical protein